MIIFLYGEDDFSSNEKLRQIKNKFKKNNPEAISVVFDFNEKEFVINEFKNIIDTDGLFSVKKNVILRNIFSDGSKDDQDEILDFLKSKKNIFSDNNLYLVVWEKSNPRKNNKLFKFLLNNSKFKEFIKKQGLQLEKWIEKSLTESNLQIQKNAIKELILYSSGNMWQLSNEIKKLKNYKNKGEVISVEDIEKIVSVGSEANIFETVEALLQGNKKHALQLLHNQLDQDSDPFYILSMYVYQFRNLLKIANLCSRGINNQYEIAKLAKIHPFVVQKGIQQVQAISLLQLKNIYKKLEQIDESAKTGKADIKLLLDRLVVSV